VNWYLIYAVLCGGFGCGFLCCRRQHVNWYLIYACELEVGAIVVGFFAAAGSM
jgi:hypothetical protein